MELKPANRKKVYQSLQRMIAKRIDKAIAHLRVQPTDKAVHESRKQFRQIRAFLRMMQHELGEKVFRQENRTFREASRPLSEVRDARVLIDTIDALAEHFADRVKPDTFRQLRSALQKRRREVRQRVFVKERAITQILSDIRQAKSRMKDWPTIAKNWKLVGPGLKTTYRLARRSLKKASGIDHADELLHEARKRAKDLRHQLEWLAEFWPEILKPIAEQAHAVTNALGLDHDLAVLRGLVLDDLAESMASTDRELLIALIDERRTVLQDQGRILGEKLFAERPRDFVDRIRIYWKSEAKKESSDGLVAAEGD